MAELEQYADGYSALSLRVPGKETVFVTNEADISWDGDNDIDEQKPDGKNLGRPKSKGVKLTTCNVSWIIYADEEAHFWGKVYPFMREKGKRGNVQPLDLINPQATRANITTAFIVHYHIGQPSARDGRQITIKFKEWAPKPVEPKPANNTKQQYGPPTLQQFVAQNAEVNVFN